MLERDPVASPARGVGHNEDALAPVRSPDGASWYKQRPDGVAFALQVSAHAVEPQADVPSNVLKQRPSWPEVSDGCKQVRPEVAVIIRASSLPGGGEGLAGVAAGNEVDLVQLVEGERPHVAPARDMRPVPGEDGEAALIYFHLPGAGHARALQPQGYAADARAEVEEAHTLRHLQASPRDLEVLLGQLDADAGPAGLLAGRGRGPAA